MSLATKPARFPEDLDLVRDLFREYAAEWQLNLCFQNFEAELSSLPGAYAAPLGLMLIGWDEEAPTGCVALRPFGPEIGELKRLYVRPAWRNRGLGRLLTSRILEKAATLNYSRVRLDTLARMTAAVRLYESLGFYRIPAYRPNPESDVLYFEHKL